MKTSPRSDRVRGLIKEVVSNLLTRHIQDPRLHLVTITGVELSRDLRIATLFFTVTGGPKARQDALAGFESARGFLKKSAAPELGLKFMPDFRFRYDPSFDYGEEMEKKIKDVRKKDQEYHIDDDNEGTGTHSDPSS